MSSVLVELTIGDYDKWLKGFNAGEGLRAKVGVTSSRVYRSADRPNEVLVWAQTSDLAKTRTGLTAPELASAMRESGVMGPPRITDVP